MTIRELDAKRLSLISEADILIAKQKKLYSNMDIESPKSQDEKDLDSQISSLFSQIQEIIRQKRLLK